MKYSFRLIGIFAVLCAVAPPAIAADKKTDDGFVPMFNGKDLTGWVNVNCAPEHLLREGRRDHHHRQADRLPAHREAVRELHRRVRLDARAAQARRGRQHRLLRLGRPDPGRRHRLHARHRGAGARQPRPTRTRRARSRPPARATCSASGGRRASRPAAPRRLGALPAVARTTPRASSEWNHYRVEANDGVIKLAVNGKDVSGVSKCKPRKGYLALESEGSECHFRNLKIKELPSTNPKPDEIADVAKGFTEPVHRPGPVGLEGGRRGEEALAAERLGAALRRQGRRQLRTEKEYGDAEFIVDFRFPKEGASPCTFVLRDGNDGDVKLVVKSEGKSIWIVGGGKASGRIEDFKSAGQRQPAARDALPRLPMSPASTASSPGSSRFLHPRRRGQSSSPACRGDGLRQCLRAKLRRSKARI